MKKREKKDLIKLCFRYNTNCKLCPRNKKCEYELETERLNDKNGNSEKESGRTKAI